MAQAAAHLVDHVIPHLPVRQWVLSLPIPLRLLLAAQPKLVMPVLQAVHRMITRHLLGQTGLKADEANSGAVTLIQRFGSAANLNIHLHRLLLDGMYRRSADGAPVFVEVPAPTDEALQTVLQGIITPTTAPDPFGVRVTLLREVSGPPLRTMVCWHRTPSCARWWCRKTLSRQPRPHNRPSAGRTVPTTARCA